MKIMYNFSKEDLIKGIHIGDGLYMKFTGYSVEIAVNHHENVVAAIDMNDFERAKEFIDACQTTPMK